MTLTVLQSKAQVVVARRELERRGLSALDGRLAHWFHQWGWRTQVPVGHDLKSWDILTTADFIQEHLPREAPILDIGAYASEILCVLHRANYTALTGVDLNPNMGHMPFADSIRWEVGNFLQAPFADQSFAAVTAISVIEHGFQSQALLKEMSRLLRPGGYFLASFDYWSDKIDTRQKPIFGMDWRIFSRAEVATLIDEARAYGLAPCGPLDYEAAHPAITWEGWHYTFAWLALQMRAA